MRKFYKPEIEITLRPLLMQATKNGQKTPEKWLDEFTPALAEILRKDPKQYRSYGPFWWLVKKIFLSKGIDDFGDFIDAEWFEMAQYGNPVWDMIAAYAYSDYAFTNGFVYSNGHPVVFINENGETEESAYSLIDDDMEALIYK